jgi:hypothetical protein
MGVGHSPALQHPRHACPPSPATRRSSIDASGVPMWPMPLPRPGKPDLRRLPRQPPWLARASLRGPPFLRAWTARVLRPRCIRISQVRLLFLRHEPRSGKSGCAESMASSFSSCCAWLLCTQTLFRSRALPTVSASRRLTRACTPWFDREKSTTGERLPAKHTWLCAPARGWRSRMTRSPHQV